MAYPIGKKRYIHSRFWTDTYIDKLDPIEKLLFLYLLTNERVTIAGVYELPLKIMSVETGIEKEMVEKIIKRFESEGKIYFFEGWIYLKNFQKYQNLDNASIKKGIENVTNDIPEHIKEYIKSLDESSTTPTPLPTELESKSELESESESITASPKDVVNFFFELKGWANKDKSFYKNQKIIYARFLRPAKDLLTLCEGNLEEVKVCLSRVCEWAKSHDLDWAIETVFKKWYEIDNLKLREKKPYINGLRAYKKDGRWHVITKDGEFKPYSFPPKSYGFKGHEIEWR